MPNLPCKELAFPQNVAQPAKRAREESCVSATMQHAQAASSAFPALPAPQEPNYPPPFVPPTPKAGSRVRGGKGGSSSAGIDGVVSEFQRMMGGRSSPDVIRRAVERRLASSDAGEAKAMRSVLGQYCHHCLYNGRAVVKHSRDECKRLGNSPCLPCPKCALRNIVEWHWPDECGKKR